MQRSTLRVQRRLKSQVATAMRRLYRYGLTTTSGGNISVRDERGDIYISPTRVDKYSLRENDIVCVRADGTAEGRHNPSSELPFHRAIYRRRNAVRAIVHAHPPSLVSFSIVHKGPDTRVFTKAHGLCGKVGIAKLALPGSEELGEKLAEVFEAGCNSAILENHGITVVGSSLFEAYSRLETLNFCARLLIKASLLGRPIPLSKGE